MRGSPGRARATRVRLAGGVLACVVAVASTDVWANQRSAASNEGLGAFLWPDSYGISVLREGARRSPTGLLYPPPFELAPFRDVADERFLSRGAIELGGIGSFGDTDNARFIEYADWSDGFLLRRFALDVRQREGGGYLELGGGSVGRDDQFYRLEVGRFGWGRFRSTYDSLRHVYADNARVLFEGGGTEELTLPPGLPLGESSPEQIAQALSTVGRSQIGQDRDVTGADFRVRLLPELTLSADYTLQRRSGERPFGGTLGMTMGTTSAGSVIETLEPLQSRTHDWAARVAWATKPVQVNLAYRGSMYDTNRSSLTWQNPFRLAEISLPSLPEPISIPGFPEGRAALPPDNRLHQVVGDVGVALPGGGRFTTNMSWTKMSQDERLLPATINPLATFAGTLSRERAGAEVEQVTMRSMLRFRPLRKLTVQVSGSYFDRQNDTDYFSYDPEDDFYGYVVEDTTQPAQRVGSVPFAYHRWNIEGGVQWRPVRHSRLGVQVEHEVTERLHRARREVSDDRLRLQLSTRAVPDTTLRLSYEFQHRTGSNYDPARDQRYYAFSPGDTQLAGPGRSLREFRQYDLADHDRHELQLRLNWLAAESVDVSFTGRYRDADFGSDYGLTGEQALEVNAEVAYPVSSNLDAYAFGSFEWREGALVTINGFGAGGTAADYVAGGPFFPLGNRWRAETEALAAAFGAGFRVRVMDDVLIEADYRYLWTDEDTSTDFDRTGGALLTPPLDPATARSGFPALRMTDHVLDLAVRYRVSEPLEFKALYRLQRSAISNFYQQGLVPLVNQNLYLAIRDHDYTASVFAVTAVLRY